MMKQRWGLDRNKVLRPKIQVHQNYAYYLPVYRYAEQIREVWHRALSCWNNVRRLLALMNGTTAGARSSSMWRCPVRLPRTATSLERVWYDIALHTSYFRRRSGRPHVHIVAETFIASPVDPVTSITMTGNLDLSLKNTAFQWFWFRRTWWRAHCSLSRRWRSVNCIPWYGRRSSIPCLASLFLSTNFVIVSPAGCHSNRRCC